MKIKFTHTKGIIIPNPIKIIAWAENIIVLVKGNDATNSKVPSSSDFAPILFINPMMQTAISNGMNKFMRYPETSPSKDHIESQLLIPNALSTTELSEKPDVSRAFFWPSIKFSFKFEFPKAKGIIIK